MISDKISFSIIVPTCNRPQQLALALDSIALQTYLSFEVFIINNGTIENHKDDYLTIQKSFDKRFKFLNYYNDDAQGFGPAIARNLGVSKASGDYLLFLDDDDIWVDNSYLQRLQEITERFAPEILISEQTGVSMSGDKETLIRPKWFPNIDKSPYYTTVTDNLGIVTLDYFSCAGVFPHINITVYKHSLLEKTKGFNKGLWYEEDLEMFLRSVDNVDKIYVSNLLVAKHYIPIKEEKLNISANITDINKHCTRINLANDLLAKVKSKQVKRFIFNMMSHSAKHLSQFYGKNNEIKLEKMYATIALRAKFTFKWHVYCCFLNVKHSYHRFFK